MSATAHAGGINWGLLAVGVVGIGALLYFTKGGTELPAGGGDSSVPSSGGFLGFPQGNIITPPAQYATTYNFPAPNMGGGNPDMSAFNALLASLGLGGGQADLGGAGATPAKKDTAGGDTGGGQVLYTPGYDNLITQSGQFAKTTYADQRNYITLPNGQKLDVQGKTSVMKKDSTGIDYLSITDLQRGGTEMRVYDTAAGLAGLDALTKKNSSAPSPYLAGAELPDTVVTGFSGQYTYNKKTATLTWNKGGIDASTGMGYGVSAIDPVTGAPLAWQRDVFIGNAQGLLYNPRTGAGDPYTIAAANNDTFTMSRELSPAEYQKAYYQSVVTGNALARGQTVPSWNTLSSAQQSQVTSKKGATTSGSSGGGGSGGWGGNSYVTGSASARNAAAGW